ncbi:MAG: ATP-binding protein, partial [Acidimicrobiia bacterium]|nr:ATP-binding protein [Acidimicrobiia bacterium]
MPIRIPFPSVIVLVGPSGSGKTTWAEANFRPGQVVSSDALRAAVGTGAHDQKASTDAFAVLESIVDM